MGDLLQFTRRFTFTEEERGRGNHELSDTRKLCLFTFSREKEREKESEECAARLSFPFYILRIIRDFRERESNPDPFAEMLSFYILDGYLGTKMVRIRPNFIL